MRIDESGGGIVVSYDSRGLTAIMVAATGVFLGHDAGASHMIEVRALIASGPTIDAIRVLREDEGPTSGGQ